jgi:peroxiredoxin|tara:strand:- start:693 stop:1349 length:657 start_codon:yes stop_codon:yes gene_type:complete
MPQINEPAPDLDISEWVQGKPSNIGQEKGRNIVIIVFQVNCPGCFNAGFPEFLESYRKFNNKPILFWGLATAFEHFQWNNLENLKKLIDQGEVVGDTFYSLNNQGMLEGNYLSYKIPFPIAWDKIYPADPLKAKDNAKKMIDRDFPNFSQLPESTQKKINDQVMAYYKDKKFSAGTFENYQLRGTPSTLLIDKNGTLRGKWFGSGFGLETEIEKLLNE